MSKVQFCVRILTAIAFIFTGTLHFLRPEPFVRIVPPLFPHPMALVLISGACEIAGGLGLLTSQLRRLAAWGLILLLIAVFPANIYMAMEPQRIEDWNLPRWALWARLPMQLLFIAVVSWVGLRKRTKM